MFINEFFCHLSKLKIPAPSAIIEYFDDKMHILAVSGMNNVSSTPSNQTAS
ncbi:hypothetical protein [Methanobrevibacter sp.]